MPFEARSSLGPGVGKLLGKVSRLLIGLALLPFGSPHLAAVEVDQPVSKRRAHHRIVGIVAALTRLVR